MNEQGVSPIGLNIARYRKAEGLSASELAEKVGEGLTRSVIANLESGRKDDVTVKQLVALANALGVPPACLVVDLFDPGSPAPYEMPSRSWEVFVVDDLEVKQRDTLKRSTEFFQWFGGRALFAEQPLEGAQKMAYEAMNALEGYNSAWGEFHRALKAYLDFEQASPDDVIDGEADYVAERLKDAAENVVRWVKALDGYGIKNSKIEATVDRAMTRVKVAYDRGVDG